MRQRSIPICIILSLITCGIYGIYWAYKMGEAMDSARTRSAVRTGSRAVGFLLLNVFGLSIVTMALLQNELNKYELI